MGDPQPILMGNSIFPGFLLLSIHFWKFLDPKYVSSLKNMVFIGQSHIGLMCDWPISFHQCISPETVSTYLLTLLMY